MATRVQVIVSPEEQERFRRVAERRGLSLSAWMRQAAVDKAAQEPAGRFETVADAESFFAACDRREGVGREPDWEQHRQVMEESRSRGTPRT